MCNFYIMYYTDSASGATSGMCSRNNLPSLVKQIPADSDKPLPPNPALDEIASGHHHHHGMNGDHDDPPQGQGREGGTQVAAKPPVAEDLTGMEYYSEPYDEDYPSFDYPQGYDSRYVGKFYDDTETDRGRNRNRYPYFHQSEKEILANQYAGQDLMTRKKNTNTSPNRNPGGGMRNSWGSVSAKKGPAYRPHPNTTPKPVKPAPLRKAPPRRPPPARPSLPATPHPTAQPVKAPGKPSTKWAHVPRSKCHAGLASVLKCCAARC